MIAHGVIEDRNKMKPEPLKKRAKKQSAHDEWLKDLRTRKIKITGPIISSERQMRKSICRDMGITMKQYRTAEKKMRREA